MTEDALHRQVARLLDAVGWLWWHTPNGGRRDRIAAARLSGLGVRPGVPDILILEPWDCEIRQGMGVAIELKVRPNRATPAQLAWIEAASLRGVLCAVCYSLDDVMDVLRSVRPLNGRRM